MEMQVAAAPPAEGLFAPRYRAPTLGAVALIALHAFEALAITTAMPTAAQSLDGLPLYALAFAATLASSVVGMVACGRWADRRGPHAPLTHGIVWFSIGLLVAGLAPSMAMLLLGRVVQGFGGGLMSVALYVAVGRVYPPALRVRVFTAFAGAWVVPAIVGPTISGLIVEHLGWRWVFLLVPVAAVLAATLVLPALRAITPLPDPLDDAGSALRERHRLAWAIAAAASALLLHWGGQQRGGLAVLALVLAAVALLVCMHRLLPRGTLRATRGLPTVIAMRGIVASVFYGTEVFLPLLLSRERGLSPTMAGAALTIGAVGWSVGSWYRGRMVDPSPARVVQTGMALLTLGLAVATLAVFPAMPLAFALVGWVIAGFGVGMVFPSISTLTLELSPPAQQGVNSSALHLSDALFTATVLALVGSLFSALLEHSPMAAYLCGFAITTALAAVGTVLGGRVRPAATL